jgi:inosine/xanthosine triphosphate pyrophosphatase family protein
MGPVFFLTSNEAKCTEIAAMLLGGAKVTVERRTASLPVPPSIAPAEVARFRALKAFAILGGPVFAEALSIELDDGVVSGASYRQAFEQPGGSSWLKKHDCEEGTARVAVGFTADGKLVKVFEIAIPGRLRTEPRGHGVAAWERHWEPKEGPRGETLATLADHGMQNRPYLDLAGYLQES